MTFEEWFEENKDELAQLLRGDQEEALYKAWLAGYEAGLLTFEHQAGRGCFER
jgi:hypothetical protein